MSKAYFCGLDIGTTGVKVMLVDEEGDICGVSYREYPCIYPHPGWVEQDVDLVWNKICEATKKVISETGADPQTIRSLGISSQRGTIIPVDRNYRPLMNSIVWSDARAGEEAAWIKDNLGVEKYHSISGVPHSALWSYSKIKWLIDRYPDFLNKTHKILNGQEYFLYLLGAEELATDPSSITLNGMMDIDSLDWSSELCSFINLPMDKLPPMKTPARMAGTLSSKAAEETGLAKGTPIAAGGGDQQCAAIGSGITREGMAEITIGTAMVMVAHIEKRPVDRERKILIGGSAIPGKWDMEGTQFTAGAALKWWRDVYASEEKLQAARENRDVYDIITANAASSPAGSKGVLFFPFFQGQSTPNYVDSARGGALGISFVHNKNDMARSVLEGITFETDMILKSMEEVLEKPFDVVRLSGGGAKSDLWCRIQADIFNRPVERLKNSECTTLGAAILGATGCGFFNSVEEGTERLVKTLDFIEPDGKNSKLYAEAAGIYREAFNALSSSGVYDKISDFQSRHWGS